MEAQMQGASVGAGGLAHFFNDAAGAAGAHLPLRAPAPLDFAAHAGGILVFSACSSRPLLQELASRALAARTGLSSVVVCPGFVETPITPAFFSAFLSTPAAPGAVVATAAALARGAAAAVPAAARGAAERLRFVMLVMPVMPPLREGSCRSRQPRVVAWERPPTDGGATRWESGAWRFMDVLRLGNPCQGDTGA
jgi:hypothetical protein